MTCTKTEFTLVAKIVMIVSGETPEVRTLRRRPDRAAALSAAKKEQTHCWCRDGWLSTLEIGGAFIVYKRSPSPSFAPRPRSGAVAGTGGPSLAASRFVVQWNTRI